MKRILAVTIMFFLIGCTLKQVKENEFALELVVRAATSRVLTEKAEWIKPCYDITKEAILRIENNELITVADLEEHIRAEINWDNLTIDEQILMDTLIAMIRDSVNDYLKDQDTLPEDVKVYLVTVLSWINKTADGYINPIPKTTYPIYEKNDIEWYKLIQNYSSWYYNKKAETVKAGADCAEEVNAMYGR
jgi:hypothetical protein